MGEYGLAILVLLAVLAVGMAFVGWQLWRLNRDLGPVLGSSLVQGLSAL